MLQFITGTNTFTLKQQVEMMLSAGCKWIEFRPDKTHKEEIIKDALTIKSMCQDKECILTIAGWVDIAKEADLDGVHLSSQDISASEARQKLGEKAIIGVTVHKFEDLNSINLHSIDYIQLGDFSTSGIDSKKDDLLSLEDYRTFMGECKSNKIKVPVVAIGTISFNDIMPLMQCGIQGIALCHTILLAPNPEEEAKKILHLLSNFSSKQNPHI